MASFTVVANEDAKEEEESSLQVLRCLTSELGCLTRQDGSAAFSHGDTSCISVVYGPTEVRMNKELIDKATVEVVYKNKVGMSRPPDKKKERIIRNTLESAIIVNLHPRSGITIVIQETEDLGSNLACCINAACMGLLDAAVSMDFMVAAVAATVDKDSNIIVDPSKKEEDEGHANMTFVFESLSFNVVSVVTSGRFSQEEYKQAVKLTRQTANSVFQYYRNSLSKKLLKSL